MTSILVGIVMQKYSKLINGLFVIFAPYAVREGDGIGGNLTNV